MIRSLFFKSYICVGCIFDEFSPIVPNIAKYCEDRFLYASTQVSISRSVTQWFLSKPMNYLINIINTLKTQSSI